MHARKKKSKKLSGTNNSLLNRVPVLFLDENTSSKHVIDALSASGFTVEIHRDHFTPGTADEVWLQKIAQRKWIVITRDRRIRYRPNEIAAARVSGVRIIFITGGNLSSTDLAAILIRHSRKLIKFVTTRRKSFVATMTQNGLITELK